MRIPYLQIAVPRRPRPVGGVAPHTGQKKAPSSSGSTSPSGNKGAYALRRIDRDTAHFLMATLKESEVVVRAFAGEYIGVAKCHDLDEDFPLELKPCSTSVSPMLVRKAPVQRYHSHGRGVSSTERAS